MLSNPKLFLLFFLPYLTALITVTVIALVAIEGNPALAETTPIRGAMWALVISGASLLGILPAMAALTLMRKSKEGLSKRDREQQAGKASLPRQVSHLNTEGLTEPLKQSSSNEAKLQAVLRSMAEGVILIDAKGTIQLANQRAHALFRIPSEQTLVNQPILSVSRDPELQELVRMITEQRFRTPIVREVHFDVEGVPQVYQVSATPVVGASNSEDSSLSILVFHDITQIKKLEAARRDFVANVSHELRTPLTAIRGYAETLRAGAAAKPELAEKFLSVIEQHSERLSRLTDDLLTLSDLELGKAELQRIPTPLGSSVQIAIELLQDKASQSEVVIETRLPDDLPLVWAAPDHVVQLLVNLLDNAVKYSSASGTITLHGRVVEFDRANLQDGTVDSTTVGVELCIEDTGTGIPSHDLPRLTERFYRVDKARSRELGGTGLGLAIVKHIVQAHAGNLRVESELGRGTSVFITLPCVADQSEKELSQQPSEAEARRSPASE